MQLLQRIKVIQVTAPVAINDNTAYTTNSVDTLGWDEVLFEIAFGAMDIAVAALKVREADDDSTYSDVTGADFSVSPATLPSATDDNHFYGVHVKCGGARKRYLDLSFTAGDGAAGTFAAVNAILARGETEPSSATTQGFTQLLKV